jgi:hypothetical protein
MMISPQLQNALTIFKNDVAFFYRKHEETFDLESFHGRFHIIRCLLLADAMHQYYETIAITLDIEKSYYAILFHDMMRENNGVDLWESQSADKCFTFLKQNGYSQQYAFQTSKMILKGNNTVFEEQILYDVDVLDYHRFFNLPEERHLFEDFRLKFAGPNDINGQIDITAREKIILLAQQLVKFCETISVKTETDILVELVLDYYLQLKLWEVK